jgi:hypothetical protein
MLTRVEFGETFLISSMRANHEVAVLLVQTVEKELQQVLYSRVTSTTRTYIAHLVHDALWRLIAEYPRIGAIVMKVPTPQDLVTLSLEDVGRYDDKRVRVDFHPKVIDAARRWPIYQDAVDRKAEAEPLLDKLLEEDRAYWLKRMTAHKRRSGMLRQEHRDLSKKILRQDIAIADVRIRKCLAGLPIAAWQSSDEWHGWVDRLKEIEKTLERSTRTPGKEKELNEAETTGIRQEGTPGTICNGIPGGDGS